MEQVSPVLRNLIRVLGKGDDRMGKTLRPDPLGHLHGRCAVLAVAQKQHIRIHSVQIQCIDICVGLAFYTPNLKPPRQDAAGV